MVSSNATTPVLVNSLNPDDAALLAIILPQAQGVPIDVLAGSHRTVEAVGEALRRGETSDISAVASNHTWTDA